MDDGEENGPQMAQIDTDKKKKCKRENLKLKLTNL
jgi:hypothetical protein